MSGYWYHAGTVEQLAHRDGIEAALSHPGARDAGGDRDGQFDDAIPFPDTAWRGLFGDYLALVRGTTEAAPALHFAAFAAYFGLALGRTVWCAAPQTHVNVSALLLGPSGDSRKSTTLGLAENTFALLSDPPVTMYGVASAEAIYRRLATAPETRVLVFADEFRALVAAGHRQATGNLFPRLNSLSRCPARDSLDRSKVGDSIEIERPFVSVLAASPVGWLEGALDDGLVQGGAINRFMIFVDPDDAEPLAFPEAVSEDERQRLARAIEGTVAFYREHGRPLTWGADARAAWEAFYVAWRGNRRVLLDTERALTARTAEHALKLALLLSAACRERSITSGALEAALAVAEYLERGARQLMATATVPLRARIEALILAALRRCGGESTRRALHQALGGRVSAEEYGRALKALEDVGSITTADEPTCAGQMRRMVRLAPGGDHA